MTIYTITAISNAFSDGVRPVSAFIVGTYTDELAAFLAYEEAKSKYWLCKVEKHETTLISVPADASGW